MEFSENSVLQIPDQSIPASEVEGTGSTVSSIGVSPNAGSILGSFVVPQEVQVESDPAKGFPHPEQVYGAPGTIADDSGDVGWIGTRLILVPQEIQKLRPSPIPAPQLVQNLGLVVIWSSTTQSRKRMYYRPGYLTA